ncbi:MAG: hypothetical protein NTY16_03560, partial [Deltaproteobacteria bacterium]|nr:hypothetical protein [Deltaproteobacteria bacterium]
MIKGKEIITVSHEQISLRHEIMGLGRTHCYRKDNIKVLSIAPDFSDFYLPLFSTAFGPRSTGPIWFRLKRPPNRHFSPSQPLFGLINYT